MTFSGARGGARQYSSPGSELAPSEPAQEGRPGGFGGTQSPVVESIPVVILTISASGTDIPGELSPMRTATLPRLQISRGS
jgi:hypothetical protein